MALIDGDRMRVYVEEFSVKTSKGIGVVDITHTIESIVSKSGIKNGIVLVHVPHATAAIIANEYEPRLAEDYVELIRELFKPGYNWKHNTIDNNAHAHLAAALIGNARVFPVLDGSILRGTWQNIILLELDGPRNRRVVVEVMGE